MNVLRADNIWRVFPGTKGPIEVLRGIDFSVAEGEVVVILGASGAGKSTLLHVLGTLDRPDRGRVYIKDADIRECSEGELNRIRNIELGFVFQFHYLLPEFNAIENVMMPALLRRVRPDEARERAIRLLGEVGLADRLYHRPAELSGGEQQRVAVARALANEPSIVLADEPSGNLDDRNSEGLHELIGKLSAMKRQTFVVVTHKRELLRRADRALILRDGGLHPFEEGSDDLPVL